MLDWLGKMLDLPAEFLACSGGKGGGVIQVNFPNDFFLFGIGKSLLGRLSQRCQILRLVYL